MTGPQDREQPAAQRPATQRPPVEWPGGGLSWSWELDLNALQNALNSEPPWLRTDAVRGPGTGPGGAATAATGTAATGTAATGTAKAGDPKADPWEDPEWWESAEPGPEVPLASVAGRVAESLPTGPGLAAWLAQGPADELEDGALAGVATSFRRLASWAAAGELAVVAQMASRSARADQRAKVDPHGRPDRVTADAAGQVALAFSMSQDGANAWTDLAVTLGWRLRKTWKALSAGEIDLARARMIARMTASLDDETARLVEAAVLDRAGLLTLGQLGQALRQAVIRADPEGAERRREQAEKNAKVELYPEDEGTATLAGYALPGIQAAAAMARITALATALKAAGKTGGIDLLRSQVFLGLLLDTLPYIPPAPGAPDDPRPDGPRPDDPPPAGRRGGGPGEDDPGADPDPGCEAEWPDTPEFLAPGPSERAGAADRGPGVAGLAGVRPAAGAGGLLGLTVPYATLAGLSAGPGKLTRLGVVTAGQARYLARLAAADPVCRWRVIVTDPAGQAIAVAHVPRAGPDHDPPSVGLASSVTLTISADGLDQCDPPSPDLRLARVLALALAAARRAAAEAAEQAKTDADAGGCAHGKASSTYRPPPRIRELVRARDGTCRFAPCRRPAGQSDLDHTVPFDQGGITCSCNIGPECRFHHQLKQHPRWQLTQPAPGVFRWTTPAGRSYVVYPDPHPV
jgi:hypothetical protein